MEVNAIALPCPNLGKVVGSPSYDFARGTIPSIQCDVDLPTKCHISGDAAPRTKLCEYVGGFATPAWPITFDSYPSGFVTRSPLYFLYCKSFAMRPDVSIAIYSNHSKRSHDCISPNSQWSFGLIDETPRYVLKYVVTGISNVLAIAVFVSQVVFEENQVLDLSKFTRCLDSWQNNWRTSFMTTACFIDASPNNSKSSVKKR